MTRETKLGLVVATSFLSLVAVVAYNAWTKPEIPQTPQDVKPPVILAQNTPAPKHDQKPDGEVAPVRFQENAQVPRMPVNPPALKVPGSEGSALPPPSNGAIGSGPKKDLASQSKETAPTPPAIPPALPPSQIDDLLKKNSEVPAPAPNVGGDPLKSIPPAGPGQVSSVDIPQVPMPTKPGGIDMPPLDPMPTPSLGQQKPQPASPGAPTQVAPLPDSPAKGPAGPMPGLDVGSPTPVIPPAPVPSQFPGNTLDPKQPEPQPVAPPVNPITPKGPPAIGTVPEIGTQNAIASPPIAVPGVPPSPSGIATKPQVESFDERKYICKPTDPDFAAISKQEYGSDKYAQALIEYNRAHPLGKMSVGKAPQTIAGTEVYVPPLHVLESKYAAGAANGQPAVPAGPLKQMVPVVTGPSTGSPVPDMPPAATGWGNPPPPVTAPTQPVAPSVAPRAAPVAPPPVANPAGTGPLQQYVVPAGGQQFWQIARDTLGDGNRWAEIYQLNQQYDPQLMLPAGAQLKLPPNARVGQ
jgi:hypothetical protein